MTMDDSRRGIVAGLVLLVAGGAIVAGASLDWFSLTTPAVAFEGGAVSGSYSGIETGALGWIVLAAGGLVVLAGLIWIATRSGRAASIVAVLAGAIALGIGIYQLSRVEAAFVDVAASKEATDQLPADKISDLLGRLIDAGQVGVDPGIGLYLVLAGGLAAAAFGMVGVFRAGSRGSAPGYEPPEFAVPTDPAGEPADREAGEPVAPVEPIAEPGSVPSSDAPRDAGEWR
jgi:hypothetical protein